VSQTSNPKKLAIFSWCLYDFANTIFSMNVISLYFALWVTVDHDGQDILYSTALSLSMLAVALSVPVFGALSDTTGKRRAPLIGLTLLCIFSTGLIGTTDHLWTGLILFMVANYGYQSALVFYNGMLPSISQGSHVGLVSGYGVALGYLGSIIGMLMVKPFFLLPVYCCSFLSPASCLLKIVKLGPFPFSALRKHSILSRKLFFVPGNTILCSGLF
jgi:UMF1 family MFS transporter